MQAPGQGCFCYSILSEPNIMLVSKMTITLHSTKELTFERESENQHMWEWNKLHMFLTVEDGRTRVPCVVDTSSIPTICWEAAQQVESTGVAVWGTRLQSCRELDLFYLTSSVLSRFSYYCYADERGKCMWSSVYNMVSRQMLVPLPRTQRSWEAVLQCQLPLLRKKIKIKN